MKGWWVRWVLQSWGQANSAMPTSGESCGQRETCSPGIFGGQVSLKAGENRSSGINLRQTPLIHAAMAGILSEVQSLLTEKCDPDSQDDLGMTALMWTACSLYYPASWKQDHTGVASLLLKSKASIDLADNNGVTALMHAVANTGLGASELTHRQQRHGRPTLYWERTCRATDVEDMIQLMINWRPGLMQVCCLERLLTVQWQSHSIHTRIFQLYNSWKGALRRTFFLLRWHK